MMKLFLIASAVLTVLIIVFPLNMAFAQDIDVGEAEEEAAATVILEELEIKLKALEVFYIPRRDIPLPPVEFAGTFISGYLEPSYELFAISPKDKEPMKIDDFKKMFAKERK